MRRLIFIILVLLSLGAKAQIQDVKFSQFFNFPLNINPAATGNITETYRVAGIYRQQWSSINAEFVTFGISGDVRFNKGFRPGDSFGVGLYAIDDHLGDNIMQNQEIGLNLAYHFPLDFQARHVISAGAGFSYAISSVNIDKLIFESQYQGFVPDVNVPHGEPFTSDQQANYDINAGISYTFLINPKWQTSIGAGLLNIIDPQEGFFSDSLARVGMKRKVLSGSVKYKVNNRLALVPRWLANMEQQATEISTGVVAEYDIFPDKDLQLDLGLFGQWSEYATIYAGAAIKGVEVHASYDFAISGLKNLASADEAGQGSPGVFELSLIYRGRTKKNTGSYIIPCRTF